MGKFKIRKTWLLIISEIANVYEVGDGKTPATIWAIVPSRSGAPVHLLVSRRELTELDGQLYLPVTACQRNQLGLSVKPVLQSDHLRNLVGHQIGLLQVPRSALIPSRPA